MDCKNCSHTYDGKFCPNCGQNSRANKKLVFSELVNDFFDNVFNVNKGLPYTFFNLIVNPGMVGRAYILGKRKRFTNPVRYLIIAVAIQAFIDYWFIHPELTEQPDFFYFSFLTERINDNMAIWNHTLATKYAFIHNISMILIFPMAFLVLFKKYGFNFTELLTVNFYYFSTGLILTISTILIFDQIIMINLPVPFIIMVTLGYVVWSNMKFFDSVSFWERLLKVVLALFIFMIIRVFFVVYVLSIIFPVI
ncbi:MAG: DUF3667 domain-containing protein [Flavobacteriaceae bacterium]|nr:DUF3667 domain-containing protein [Bacteroidia bacterium]NNF75273.1 DUF3667 domain-containing protein [Flavobacteriaceae bacterium]